MILKKPQIGYWLFHIIVFSSWGSELDSLFLVVKEEEKNPYNLFNSNGHKLVKIHLHYNLGYSKLHVKHSLWAGKHQKRLILFFNFLSYPSSNNGSQSNCWRKSYWRCGLVCSICQSKGTNFLPSRISWDPHLKV